MAIVDGSTLEALRKKTAVLQRREGLVLGGKMMVIVEAFSHAHCGNCIRRTRPPMTSGLPPNLGGLAARWAVGV